MSELFEAAFYNTGVGMALVSIEGRFIRTNRAFQSLLGLPAAQMLATDFQTITHPDDLRSDLELLNRLAAGEIPGYRLDKRYLRSDGTVVWAQLTASVARNADGSPRCYIAQVQDITDRMAAERALARSETRYRLIVENSGDMIVTSDAAGFLTFVTPASRRLLGYEPEEMIGALGTLYVHPDDIEGLRAEFADLKAGSPPGRRRWRGRHKSGDRWVWPESNAAHLPPRGAFGRDGDRCGPRRHGRGSAVGGAG